MARERRLVFFHNFYLYLYANYYWREFSNNAFNSAF
jgi:hypothetical protein